jgi:hypothetical protein
MNDEVAHVKPFPRVSLVCALLLSPLAVGTEHSTLIGTVVDGESQQPLEDVLVVASAPELELERVVVTDSRGSYSIPGLPAGTYSLRFEKDRYKPGARTDIQLRLHRTTRHDVRLFSRDSRDCERAEAPTAEVGVMYALQVGRQPPARHAMMKP